MARLSSSEGMSLEIFFKDFEFSLISYEICFLWHDKPILNKTILGRKQLRGTYAPGAIFASDFQESKLLSVLKNIIETNKAGYWKTNDPDVILAIYPEEEFPFILLRESEQSRNESQEHERSKAEKGVLPDDLITLICFVDSYAFKNCVGYCGNGVSLHLVTRRQELERFYEDLKAEYLDFKIENEVDEINREDFGYGWEPMKL